jgi:D-glycero-alpha-D-manno-heptose 1-phosphate guanylyltransferase
MKITEAIILAGGLGTRLREAVPELPKCMAPVAGKPFLHYVIKHFLQEGIERFIFSLGYKHEVIEEFLQKNYTAIDYTSTIEKEPLGTGGAIKLACGVATNKTVLVVNGDTLYAVKADKLAQAHAARQAHCTLSLKPMKNFDRYNVVELDEAGIIKRFGQRQFYASGYINGGVYALEAQAFLNGSFPLKFSFENDYLEKYYTQRTIAGVVQDEYFIDIGVPEDYERANKEFAI